MHFETDPSETPDAHVDRVGIDIDRGLAELKTVFETNGIASESLTATEAETRH